MLNIFHSKEFDEIRSVLESGKPAPGCTKCVTHEERGGKSHRDFWNEREQSQWQSLGPEPVLKGLDLDMGNLCNLKCVTCNSHNSTLWRAEEKRLGIDVLFDGKKSFDTSSLSKDVFKDLSWLKFAGGEVLLMPEHEEILDFLVTHDLARNIELVYVVNVTLSPKKFIDKWKEFRAVRMILSIDGIGESFEYIRFPADWSESEKIVNEYLEYSDVLSLEVNTVVSLYNIFQLVELDSWWLKASGGKDIFYRILNAPQFMAIGGLPESLRSEAISYLQGNPRFSHLIASLKERESGNFNEFILFVKNMERFRKNRLLDLVPRYAPYFLEN